MFCKTPHYHGAHCPDMSKGFKGSMASLPAPAVVHTVTMASPLEELVDEDSDDPDAMALRKLCSEISVRKAAIQHDVDNQTSILELLLSQPLPDMTVKYDPPKITVKTPDQINEEFRTELLAMRETAFAVIQIIETQQTKHRDDLWSAVEQRIRRENLWNNLMAMFEIEPRITKCTVADKKSQSHKKADFVNTFMNN